MAGKRITTELVIKAVDQYSSQIRNMTGVTGRFAEKVRNNMGRLQGMRGPLRMIEDFRRQQTVVRGSGDALDAANEKTRQLLATIRATKNPTAAMRREFERARGTAGRLEEKHRRNRAELRGLQSQMQSAGVDTSDLSGEQRRLAGALDAANDRFARQAERMQRVKVMQDRIADGRERMQRSLATAANLSFVGQASMQTGRRMLTGMSAPIMQAVEFESSMSDVRKVVDFESPAAFKEMSEDVLKLSTRIPMAATGLAEIVAAGGQSGIAREELLKFAEIAAKIGVAFDISAGQSGDAMASIKTQLGLTVEQTSTLFDAMNHLSNNMASTAPKMLDYTTRVAADGEVKGFNATETIAFGSAMIAAGADADVAATSFRNMGKALARGAASTPKQRAAFKSLGLSAADVAKRMQEDAVGTTLDVMERINQLPAHLRSSTMSQIFGDEARALTPLINRLDLLREALGLVSDEQQYLGSAEAEYAERAKTTANNMQLLRNQTTRLGISIGEVVLPPLNELLSKSQVFIDKMVTWTKENPKLTRGLVMGGIALGGMAVAGGFLLTTAAALIGTVAVLRFGLVGLGARGAFAAGEIGLVRAGFRGLMRLPKFALSTLISPVRWAAPLVGRVPWVRLAGKLALSSLIVPLRWTSRLLPFFGPALSRFSGFRTSASAEITGLSSHVRTQSAAMSRSLSRIKWGAFSAGAMTYMALRNIPENPEERKAFQESNVRSMDRGLRATPGISHLISAYEKSFEWFHGFKPPVLAANLPNQAGVQSAAQTVQGYADGKSLPTDDRLQGLRDMASELREEISALQSEMDSIGTPGNAYDLVSSDYQQAKAQMAARVRDLEAVERQLYEDETAAASLSSALQVLSGTSVAPEINTDSIDRALIKVRELASAVRAIPSGGASSYMPPRPAGARAFGGSVRAGLPYRVNEHTPRSEWFVPSVSGGILNVGQAQAAFMAYLQPAARQASGASRGAQRVRSAGLAALAASAIVGAGATAAAAGGGAGRSMSARVEIGSISIVAPSGVSDPEGLVDLIETRLGERVSAVFAASLSD